MKDIILIGSGGCMRELFWQLQQDSLKKKHTNWYVAGYIDVEPKITNGSTDIVVGNKVCPYLGDDDVLLAMEEETNVAVCVGEPNLRKKIVEKLSHNPNLKFPSLILGDTRICSDVQMGQGCIVSMDSRISTNVRLGNFVFLNIGAMVCHDGRLGNYVTLSPDVKIAGNVKIGECSELGIGTKVIQGITIGNGVTTGAGSVIIRDIDDAETVAGVPAKNIH